MDVAAPNLTTPSLTAPSLATAAGRAPRRADPCAFVIFGAAGDLTKRLLLPALYNLAAGQLLPDAFAVVGVARAEMSDDEFRRQMADALKEFAGNGIHQRCARRLDRALPLRARRFRRSFHLRPPQS